MTGLMNVPRASALLARDRLDALVASGFENVGYVAGFVPPASWWLRQRALFGTYAVAVPRSEGGARRVVVAPVTQAAHYLTRDLGGVEVVPYGYFPVFEATTLGDADRRLARILRAKVQREAVEALASAIDASGLRRSRLGIDTSGLAPEDYQALARALDGAELVPATALFREIRAVKTPAEQRRMRTAAKILRGAIMESVRAARAGMSEVELTREFTRRVVDADATPTFIAIGFGERTAYPGVIPSDRRLRHGDLIRYDCGCVYELYHSDQARTFAFGAATDGARQLYRAALEGERRAIRRAGPGVPVQDVFRAAVEATRAAGIPQFERAHVGHAIGLEVYEHPMFRPDSDAVLEPGMTLTVEVPYYEIGTGGFMPEDVILVTGEGTECLTEPDAELTVL